MTTLVFELHKSAILNSNTYKSLHWAVKGKLTEGLRTTAINEGVLHHPDEHREAIDQRLEALRAEANQAVAKARRTKALQKKGELTAKEIKALVEEEFAAEELPSTKTDAPTLFNHFRIRVTVSPPTRRRLDPVNLYPTVKAIIDGLTDSHWWEDDDYSHLLELSFVYGGLSGEKDVFRLTMDVEEVGPEELEKYTLQA